MSSREEVFEVVELAEDPAPSTEGEIVESAKLEIPAAVPELARSALSYNHRCTCP